MMSGDYCSREIMFVPSIRFDHALVPLAVIIVVTPVSANEGDGLRDAIRRLESCTREDCGTAVAHLVRAGVDSLRVFLELEYPSSVAAYVFRTRVIPDLSADEAGPILLDRFRELESAFEEFAQLAKRAETGESIDDDDPAYAELFQRYRHACWTAAALGNLKYRIGYEPVYATYLSQHELRNGHFDLAQGLFGMDPERALRDFARLVLSEKEDERVKGATSFRQVTRTPDCEVFGKLFDDPVESVRTEAYQLLYHAKRECVPVLINLVANSSQNVRQASAMRLRHLASMSDAQYQILMGSLATPEQRAAMWRSWWHSAAELTDEQLREQGLEAALSAGKNQLDAQLVSFVSGYVDERVYPLLKQALSSSDETIQRAALDGVQRLAIRGEKPGVDLLLEHIEDLPVIEAAALADAVSKLHDPRVLPMLLRLMDKAPVDQPDAGQRILGALGNTQDSRAIEPVLAALLSRSDGTEQLAAMALAKLKGADAAQPRLLARLIDEKNHNMRNTLREAIRKIGGASLAKDLTTILPKAGAGNDSFEGSQKDVLMLMEDFPDPAAHTVLRRLLSADSRFSRLYAARALAKLGDTSGASVVLDDLFTPHPVPFHFYAADVGKALKDIDDPGTRARLEFLCFRVDGDKLQRVFQVIAQQEDPSYIPFLAKMIRHGDRATQCGAASAIFSLFYHTPIADKRRALDLTLDSDVKVAKAMLRWAFRDERPREDCGRYPDHELLKRMNGAVVEISKMRYARYEVATDSLVALSSSSADDRAMVEKAKPRNEDTWAFGALGFEESQGFASVFLSLDYGGTGCLFQAGGFGWEPICPTGGFIE